MGIVRARTVKFNLKIASCRVQGSLKPRFAHTGKFGANSLLHVRCGSYGTTNSMLQLVLARGLSGRDMGNTNLKWALCGHVLFRFNWN